jgi:hypothetical protein
MKIKILVVTPRFPFEGKGACEQDRAWGIRRLVELGFEVCVITKSLKSDLSKVAEAEEFSGARVIPILYTSEKDLSEQQRFSRMLGRLRNPVFIDGAAYEYTESEIQQVLRGELDHFKPDLVWFDYTYLWPLYKEVRKRRIPIVTRSINFEPIHFLEEDGYKLKNYLKYLPKLASEWLSVRGSNLVFSITPNEEKRYKRWHKNVANLPLRGLPRVIKESHDIREIRPFHVFFMGSTYNVFHNREALLFVVRDLAPRIEKTNPGEFVFHILGSKVPDFVHKYFNKNVIYDGPKYGEELEKFLSSMDIALIPSLMGAGMQQKIFEPLSRGIPTLTSSRGLAGYPFINGKSVLCADNLQGFAEQLLQMRDKQLRQKLSTSSIELAQEVFSQEVIDSGVSSVMKIALEK